LGAGYAWAAEEAMAHTQLRQSYDDYFMVGSRLRLFFEANEFSNLS
jgi:hypothetical protein